MLNPQPAAQLIKERWSHAPRLAFVLGSGLDNALPPLSNRLEIPFRDIPGFPAPTVMGHQGKLVLGEFEGHPVLAQHGRFHYYEGHSMELVTFPIRVLAELGITNVVLTNAAGGIASGMKPGDFMVLSDHINFMGTNPLRGNPPDRRFVDLSQVYSPSLRTELLRSAVKINLPVHQGVYLAVSGPCYETPAEIRAFRTLGADAVGMSTVPEAIVARQCGLEVAGISCITNQAAGLGEKPIDHAEVLHHGRTAQDRAVQWFREFIPHALSS